MKGLLIIFDGLGDRPIPTLGNITPLEAARSPNLDALARDGRCGFVDPAAPGVVVGTQRGVGALMGVSPADAEKLNRGPVEAAGVGLPLAPGDVALRCNFAILDGDSIVDRRARRVEAEAFVHLLEEIDLGDGVRATVRAATQHRGVVRLSGEGLDARVSDTDPGAAGDPQEVLTCRALVPGAQRTADAVNRLLDEARRRLEGQTANGMLTRGAGAAVPITSIVTERGLKTAVIAGEDTVIGLARLFGFDVVTDPAFNALPDTDVPGKIAAALATLADHDLVYLHFKGPDICAHDFDPAGKAAFIERVDACLGSLPGDIVIAVSGDHSTDSITGAHSADPVPSLIWAPGGPQTGCRVFGESECRENGLGRGSSIEYLTAILTAMGS